MKKFKDLINEVTVGWFLPMTKDKFNEFSKSPQLDLFNNQLMNVSKVDYENELTSALKEIGSLDSYADIVGYVKMNKINLADGSAAAKLQETLIQGGLNSLPKLLIKIQLGYISEVSERFFKEVRMWQDKLGRDTDLKDVNLDDWKYLMNLSLSSLVSELKNAFDNDSNILGEVDEELDELKSSHSNLAQKRNDFTIIKIYFNKLRSQLFDNLSGGFLETNQELPQNLAKQAQQLEQANMIITQIEFVLEFATQINQQLLSN